MERSYQRQAWGNEASRRGASGSSSLRRWLRRLLLGVMIGGMVTLAGMFVYQRGVRPATSMLTIECRDQHGCVLQTVHGEDCYVSGDRCEVCAPDLLGYSPLAGTKTVVVPDEDFLVVFDYELNYPPAIDADILADEGQIRKVTVKCYDAVSGELLHIADYNILEGSSYLIHAPFIDGRIATNVQQDGVMPDYDLTLCFYYNVVMPSGTKL